jgi:hypothetical protein
MWRFSTSSITYYPGWRPTPRWAARVLGIYAIAALCGGLFFVMYTLAFVAPREPHPNPATPPEIGTPAPPADIVIEKSPLVADTNENVRLIAISALLENKDKDPQSIKTFTDKAGLSQKYPLGFALFYADGRRTLYYTSPSRAGISFDPTSLKVSRIGDWYCMNISPVRIMGKIVKIQNTCVAHAKQVIRINDVVLDLEPLAKSSEGAAWVLGMKPAD